MKTIVMKSFTTLLFLILLFSCSSDKSGLVGNQYALLFHPMNENDPDERSLAEGMNGFNFSIEFTSDSTQVQRSRNGEYPGTWSMVGDSVYLGGERYIMKVVEGKTYLANPNQIIELIPIN